jgi:hypothetical protein
MIKVGLNANRTPGVDQPQTGFITPTPVQYVSVALSDELL